MILKQYQYPCGVCSYELCCNVMLHVCSMQLKTENSVHIYYSSTKTKLRLYCIPIPLLKSHFFSSLNETGIYRSRPLSGRLWSKIFLLFMPSLTGSQGGGGWWLFLPRKPLTIGCILTSKGSSRIFITLLPLVRDLILLDIAEWLQYISVFCLCGWYSC